MSETAGRIIRVSKVDGLVEATQSTRSRAGVDAANKAEGSSPERRDDRAGIETAIMMDEHETVAGALRTGGAGSAACRPPAEGGLFHAV